MYISDTTPSQHLGRSGQISCHLLTKNEITSLLGPLLSGVLWELYNPMGTKWELSIKAQWELRPHPWPITEYLQKQLVDPDVSMTIASRLIIYLYIHANNVDLEQCTWVTIQLICDGT